MQGVQSGQFCLLWKVIICCSSQCMIYITFFLVSFIYMFSLKWSLKRVSMIQWSVCTTQEIHWGWYIHVLLCKNYPENCVLRMFVYYSYCAKGIYFVKSICDLYDFVSFLYMFSLKWSVKLILCVLITSFIYVVKKKSSQDISKKSKQIGRKWVCKLDLFITLCCQCPRFAIH